VSVLKVHEPRFDIDTRHRIRLGLHANPPLVNWQRGAWSRTESMGYIQEVALPSGKYKNQRVMK
jgi:hypothetical protein